MVSYLDHYYHWFSFVIFPPSLCLLSTQSKVYTYAYMYTRTSFSIVPHTDLHDTFKQDLQAKCLCLWATTPYTYTHTSQSVHTSPPLYLPMEHLLMHCQASSHARIPRLHQQLTGSTNHQGQIPGLQLLGL